MKILLLLFLLFCDLTKTIKIMRILKELYKKESYDIMKRRSENRIL